MPNPELEAQHAKELSAAMSGLSSLTVEELQEGWRHWSAVEESASELSVTDTQGDGSGLGALASDGGQSLDDKEAMEDAKLTRVFADRMAAVHREELRRRGLELKSGWGERPAGGPPPRARSSPRPKPRRSSGRPRRPIPAAISATTRRPRLAPTSPSRRPALAARTSRRTSGSRRW